MRMITLMLAIALVSSAQAQQLPGLQPPQLGKIELSTGALTLQGDIYSAVITAKLTDTEGKPFTGANVYFNSSKGNLNTSFGLYPQGWLNITDSNGKTEAVLRLASLESVTVTANSGNINATITVSAKPSTTSVASTPTAIPTVPSITPSTPAPTTPRTVTATPATTPTAATPTAAATPVPTPTAATPTTTPSTPGFGVVISLLTILGALKFIRRK